MQVRAECVCGADPLRASMAAERQPASSSPICPVATAVHMDAIEVCGERACEESEFFELNAKTFRGLKSLNLSNQLKASL